MAELSRTEKENNCGNSAGDYSMLLKYRYYSIALTYGKIKAFGCAIFKKSQRGIELKPFANAKDVQFRRLSRRRKNQS
ncbi:hypothetical protein HFO98_22540 [Rhizobium leguminosarum]|uniref:hypothetical protein n=1 Tax=Rhizobium leguminosarum TaxID=384 RepID=UPI001C95129A|nr:hypothetical protein [Rhizobium leguminosarum]MBY5411182.1 hypothetical protein [Rhizobium leguminosarum]